MQRRLLDVLGGLGERFRESSQNRGRDVFVRNLVL